MKSIVASSEPGRSPASVRVSSRLARVARVDLHMRRAGPSRRRRQLRALAHLGAFDIGQRQRRGGDLRARERPKAVERRDAVELADPALRGRRIAFAPERRRGDLRLREQLGKAGIVEQRLWGDDLARLQRARFPARGPPPRSRRDLPRRWRCRRSPGRTSARPSAFTRWIANSALARAGSSSRSSVIVPGVTSRTTSRRTTDFGPRFFASAGSSSCSQTATRWPSRDEALQIIVGALDRHAAHGNVLAEVLAALGQHDAERAAGDLRVLEEQLVEIAHPIEQQAIRIGGLDLQILRHHRSQARGLSGGLDGFVHLGFLADLRERVRRP